MLNLFPEVPLFLREEHLRPGRSYAVFNKETLQYFAVVYTADDTGPVVIVSTTRDVVVGDKLSNKDFRYTPWS